jgi:RHS repeat-associated protein
MMILSQRFFGSLAFAFLLASLTANSPSASAQLTTVEEKGLPSNSSFQVGDVDTVNLQNGNLHISIPLLDSKQRGGGSLGWSLVYDTQSWIRQWIPNTGCGPKVCDPVGQFEGGFNTNVISGWRLATPYDWSVSSTNIGGTCASEPTQPYGQYTNWTVTDPQGTMHSLPLREETLGNGGTCLGQTLQGPALDGSGLFFDAESGILSLKDGTQVRLTSTVKGYYGGATLIDRNGNEAGPNDTLDRPLIETFNDPRGQYTTYTVRDSDGNQQVYRVDYQSVDLNPDICTALSPPKQFTCEQNWYSPISLPSKLTLPNGKTYVFTYVSNSSGELQQITLPDGGTISYTYSDAYQLKLNSPGQPPNAVGGRAVTTRTVTVNGVASTWNYKITLGGSNTVTDPLGNVQAYVFTDLCANGGPAQICSSNVYEASVTYSDSAGHTLRKVSNTYADEYDPVNNAVANARVIKLTTTLDNGQVTQRQTDYETFTYSCNVATYCPGTATRLNPTEVRDYDFGQGAPGALLRTTGTTYQAIDMGTATISKPQTVTVYDSSGNKAAQTVYEYDNYKRPNQPMVASGAIQHSSAYGTNYITRGNVTAVSRWRNTDGASLTSTNQYDDAGNLLSTIDPLGDKTSFDYTDSWGNTECAPSGQGKAYLTKTTNAKGQVTTSKFNSCTGTVALTADINHQTTSTTYDLLNRPAQNSYPDGGQTSYCYSDVEGSPCYDANVESVTVTGKITTSMNYVAKTIFDGLGRPIQKQVTSDPEGAVYTDTIYDALSRAYKVSNPYRTGDTEVYTTNTYDGIGRIINVTQADGSASKTEYIGNTTTVTDEAGKNRKSQTDGLGRLTSVWENPTGLNYETDYQYDVLGKLLEVDQKGGSTSSANWRTRTFAYNSLGQLLCSANPETGSPLSAAASCPNPDSGSYTAGTIRYQYDSDGDVISKTAPAPNQQGTTTVTTTYTYDQLHRLTGKSYSDGTPNVAYYYDGTAPKACTAPSLSATNVVGRESAMCDGSGATAWNYDTMGRTATEARRIGSATNQIGYTYYLDGNEKTISYPLAGDSAFTLTYNVNAAGRAYSVVDSNQVKYADVSSTWAFGAAKNYQLGTNIQLNDSYNARLQPLTMTATQINPSNTLFSKTYDFHAGSGDNGNLWGVTDGLDALGLNRPHGSVNYTYDEMNRVTAAQTLGTDCTTVNSGTRDWGDSFTIDPWGNLTAKTVTKCTAEMLSASADSRNRLAVATYDSAGNVTKNNDISYSFDAEGRITSAGGTAYAYDGDNERVSKPGKIYWKGVGSNALVETDGSGKNPTRYIFFNGERIARLDTGATSPKYYITDNLGSTALVTDATGNVLNESLFFPYGGEQVVQANDSNTYKFTGKERDTESGNDYFGARYYGSSMGRFMSPDWSAKEEGDEPVPYAKLDNPQSLNLYTYGLNNPLTETDPDGHMSTDTYVPDLDKHGGAHIDRYNKNGQNVGRYRPDGTPMKHGTKTPAPVPNSDKGKFAEAKKELEKKQQDRQQYDDDVKNRPVVAPTPPLPDALKPCVYPCVQLPPLFDPDGHHPWGPLPPFPGPNPEPLPLPPIPIPIPLPFTYSAGSPTQPNDLHQ